VSVSVIIPIRNAEATLSRSISSVLNQTYQDFEILCVVNDSTDGSEEIVRNYANSDSRIRILNSSPGIVPALNAGLRLSSFDLVARQDADDFWYPEKLQMQINFLEKNPDIDILGVQIRSVDVEFKRR